MKMHHFLRGLAGLLLAFVLTGTTACGFLHNPRLGKAYADTEFFEGSVDSCTGALVTWPFHVVIFTITSIVDQTIHTFEAIPWAAGDAADYFKLRGNGNNVMLERTIAIPKTLGTPFVFVGSYIVRWLLPLGDDRVFDIEKDKPVGPSKKPPPKPAPSAGGNAKEKNSGLFPARRACTPRPSR